MAREQDSRHDDVNYSSVNVAGQRYHPHMDTNSTHFNVGCTIHPILNNNGFQLSKCTPIYDDIYENNILLCPNNQYR